jgi:hypothetical protein
MSATTTATTASAPAPAGRRPGAPAPYRLTAWGILRSEWTKLWSLRSTWITLACAAALTPALGMMISGAYDPGDGGGEEFDPVGMPLFGLSFTQLAVAVLGVLLITGEFSTGMIRSSMAAVPRRLPVLWAKTAVFGGAVLAIFVPVSFLTFSLAQPFLSGTDLAASLGDPGVTRAILGSGVFAAYGAVLGLTIGVLLRRTAGAIATYVGVVMILPELATLLPWEWVDDVVRYLPFDVGESMGLAQPRDEVLSTPVSYLVMAAWTAAGLTAAALLLRRRDV